MKLTHLLLLSIALIFLFFPGVISAACGGAYSGSGNFNITTDVTCSDEIVAVTGQLNIQNNADAPVTQFSSDATSAYNLRSNSTAIQAAIPDLNNATPVQYTNNWDMTANHEFHIAMNETDHRIELYLNNTDNSIWVYGVDIDQNPVSGANLGGNTGFDFIVGYYGGPLIVCVDSNGDIIPLDGGYAVCDSSTDNRLTNNFTVHWANSGNAYEVVLNVTGPWTDKKIIAIDLISNSLFTTFKNGSLTLTGKGNLTLSNTNLTLTQPLTVSPGAIFTVRNSNITSNLTSSGSVNVTFGSGSMLNISNSFLSGNDTVTPLYWGWEVDTGNYFITNNHISYNGLGDDTGRNLFTSSVGGLIFNNTFVNCYSGTQCIRIQGAAVGLNISSNNFTMFASALDLENLVSTSAASVENNYFSGGLQLHSDNPAVFGVNITNNTFLTGDIGFQFSPISGVNFINNNFGISGFNSGIHGQNITTNNTMIYRNSFGEIKWANKSNLSISNSSDGISLALGDKIIIQDNRIGLLDEGVPLLVNLNTSAQITFYGIISGGTPYLLKNGVRCDNDPSLCNITSWDSGTGTVVAQVSGFSNYTTQAVAGGDLFITGVGLTPSSPVDSNNLNATYISINAGSGAWAQPIFNWFNTKTGSLASDTLINLPFYTNSSNIFDFSGNNYNGTVSGTPLLNNNSNFQGSLFFNGTNEQQYVNVTHGNTLNFTAMHGGFTLMIGFDPADNLDFTNHPAVLSRAVAPSNLIELLLDTSDGGSAHIYWGTTSGDNAGFFVPIGHDAHPLTLVYNDSNQIKVYLDGILNQSVVIDGTNQINSDAGALLMGAMAQVSPDPSDDNFTGDITGLRLWNRSLSANEISVTSENFFNNSIIHSDATTVGEQWKVKGYIFNDLGQVNLTGPQSSLVTISSGGGSGSGGSVFNVTGHVTFNNGTVASGVNVSMYADDGMGGLVYTGNTTTTNVTGDYTVRFNTSQAFNSFQIVFKLRNSTSGAIQYMGPTLPLFPAQMFSEMFSQMNITIYPAATITVNASRRFNSTNTTEVPVNFSGSLADTKYGFMISNFFPRQQGGDAVNNISVEVLSGRNYTLSVLKIGNYQGGERGSAPRSLAITTINLTSNVDSNNTFALTLNLTDTPLLVSGNLTINAIGIDPTNNQVNYTSIILYPYANGKVVLGSFGGISPTGFGSAPGGQDFGGWLNFTPNSGSAGYNFTAMGSAAGINYLMVIYAYNGSAPGSTARYFAAFQNITLTTSNINNFNLTLYELAGQFVPSSSPQDSNGTRFILNLKNNDTVNTRLRNEGSAAAEGAITYNSTTGFNRAPNGGPNGWGSVTVNFIATTNNSGSAMIPVIKDTKFTVRVFNQKFAPVKRKINSTINTTTIELTGQKFHKPNSTEEFTTISMLFLTSNSTCDVQEPDMRADTAGGCLISNFTAGSEGHFNPMKMMMSGNEINLMIKDATTGVTGLFIGTDMFASGPPNMEMPSGATSSSTAGSILTQAWRFGSLAPEVFRYAYIGIPYSDSALDDSGTTKVQLTNLYDEDWNGQWTTAQGLNSVPPDFADYNQSFFNSSLGGITCITNSSSDCYINKTTNIIWLKMPHFSGSDPQITGTAAASSSSSTSTTSSSGTSADGLLSINTNVSCPDGTANVTITDKNGNPVSEAAVKLILYTPYLGQVALNSTDSRGVVAFTLPRKADYGIDVTKSSYTPSTKIFSFDGCTLPVVTVTNQTTNDNVTIVVTPQENNTTNQSVLSEDPQKSAALSAIADAGFAIKDALKEGKIVSPANAKLEQANAALARGEYEKAMKLANEAKSLAFMAPRSGTMEVLKTDKTEDIGTTNLGYLAGGLVLMVILIAAIGALAYLLLKGKGSSKGYKK